MPKTAITLRLDDDLLEAIDQEADEQDLSRSEYLRRILRDRDRVDDLEEAVERLRDRLDDREQRVSELEEQLARRSQLEEKVDKLATQEQSVDEDAPFFIRWYRWYRRREE